MQANRLALVGLLLVGCTPSALQAGLGSVGQGLNASQVAQTSAPTPTPQIVYVQATPTPVSSGVYAGAPYPRPSEIPAFPVSTPAPVSSADALLAEGFKEFQSQVLVFEFPGFTMSYPNTWDKYSITAPRAQSGLLFNAGKDFGTDNGFEYRLVRSPVMESLDGRLQKFNADPNYSSRESAYGKLDGEDALVTRGNYRQDDGAITVNMNSFSIRDGILYNSVLLVYSKTDSRLSTLAQIQFRYLLTAWHWSK